MELKKLVPWNWFKKEDEYSRQSTLPVHRQGNNPIVSPVRQFHQEIDRMFDDFFRGFGFTAIGFGRDFPAFAQSEWLKPTVDIAVTERDYIISVEIPGTPSTFCREKTITWILGTSHFPQTFPKQQRERHVLLFRQANEISAEIV